MSTKLLMLALFSCLLGLHASTGVSAELNSTTQQLASDDEEGQQDVYNAGEGFYIWTTTSTKIA